MAAVWWLGTGSWKTVADSPIYHTAWNSQILCFEKKPLRPRLQAATNLSGSRIHDARIAALCLNHGVRELWTADRDFSSFPQLKTRNPLVKT